MPLSSLEFSASRHTLRKGAGRHNWAHLMLPMKTNNHHRAHLILPMRAQGHCQLCLARPMDASSHRQHRGVLRKHKGPGAAGAESVELLLPIPPQVSARKLTTKLKAPVSTRGGQIGIAAQQRRLLMRGRSLPSHLPS